MELKASPFAILIELAMQHIPVPMYISSNDYGNATAIMKCNFELGAFLNLQPLLAEKTPSASNDLTAFKHIYSMQKML